MNEEKYFYQKLWVQLYIFPVLAVLIFYNKWTAGISALFVFLYNLASYAVFFIIGKGGEISFSEVSQSWSAPIMFVLWTALLYFLLYKLSLFMMVQFLLPVTKWEDRKKAYNRISLFARGKHGAAISIKNGKQIARQSELDSKKPGVALVDLSSAIVLVQHDNVESWFLQGEDDPNPVAQKTQTIKFPWKKKETNLSPYDAKGPGVVFIEKGQKIDSVIDLRQQTRTSDEVVVYTRNGIKVKSKVTVVFSLSDDPEVLQVGFVGGKNLGDLKILKTEQIRNDVLIKDFYELQADDAEEIINSIYKNSTNTVVKELTGSPYRFNQNRVLAAVLTQARDKNGETIFWHNAPLEVATDIFRTTLVAVPYDNLSSGGDVYNLYNPDTSNKNAIPASQTLEDIKEDFSRKVKLRGMVAFQFMEHLSGAPFYKGQSVPLRSIKKRNPITLVNEKYNFFRHRGIVVKKAFFSEIQAVEDKIQQKMAANWKAKIENEMAVSDSEYELEAIRVHNRNRSSLQEEMTHQLSSMFQSTPHFDEALALRVLQALETSVADASSKDMQSTDVYEILKNLHDWILSDESNTDAPNKGTDKNGNNHASPTKPEDNLH